MSDCDNNNNKYYIIQLLRGLDGTIYHHTRYGRVGNSQGNTLDPVRDLEDGIEAYRITYKKKTAKSKGYKEIEMKLGAPDKYEDVHPDLDNISKGKTAESYPESKLDKRIQRLLAFINDRNLMEKSVTQVGYDIQKLPLGQLSDETVKDGYKSLRQIENILMKIEKKKTTLSKEMPKLKELTNQFYTSIPHNFGMSKMRNFIIDNEDMLK